MLLLSLPLSMLRDNLVNSVQTTEQLTNTCKIEKLSVSVISVEFIRLLAHVSSMFQPMIEFNRAVHGSFHVKSTRNFGSPLGF